MTRQAVPKGAPQRKQTVDSPPDAQETVQAQDQVCCDLSMRRPGFALQHYDRPTRTVTVVRKSNVDNKHTRASASKCHGQILSEIAREQRSYQEGMDDAIQVREGGFYEHARETEVQSKVMGVADQYAWAYGGKKFVEYSPTAIKKLVGGSGSAGKEEVAAGLFPYVGEQTYVCDDESDAVAVGITFLLKHKLQDRVPVPLPKPDGDRT